MTTCFENAGSRNFRTITLPTLLLATAMLTCGSTFAQSTAISGTLTGSQTFNASSGSGTITGNATLQGTTNFSLNFGIQYLVIGGGGGGGFGSADCGGGGGAGGYRTNVPGSTSGGNSSAEAAFALGAGTYTVTVGAGGLASGVSSSSGGSGGNSVFATITSLGGGGGGSANGMGSGGNTPNSNNGGSGGSGGGAANRINDNATSSNWGTPGNGTSGQGTNGGDYVRGGNNFGGGGGGAGGAAVPNGVAGGGLSSFITGSAVTRAAGGNGGDYNGTRTATAGAANTGNGGSGGNRNANNSKDGGSGIVVARYLGSAFATGGSTTIGTGSAAGYTIHTFATTGTTSFVLPDLNNRLAATVTGNLSGTGGLTVNGPGFLTLAGVNSYTGATNVNTGLLVNGTLGNTAVTVNNSGLLGGSGRIDGSVSVLSGGTFSPGNSPGLISVGSLNLEGTTLMEINGLTRGSLYDAADVTGALTYGGAMSIVFNSSLTSAFADNTSFNFFDFASQSGAFGSITTANNGAYYGGLTFTQAGDKWTAIKGAQTLEFTQSTGNLVIVPEPLMLGLLGVGSGVAAIGFRRLRRRRDSASAPATA